MNQPVEILSLYPEVQDWSAQIKYIKEKDATKNN